MPTIMMKHIICCIVGLLAMFAVSCTDHSSRSVADDYPRSLADALNIIDLELAKKPNYVKTHLEHIDSLKSLLNTVSEADTGMRYAVYDQLVESYKHFNLDSLLKYSDIASTYASLHGDYDRAKCCEIKKMHALPLLGNLLEAVELIDTTNLANLCPQNRELFLLQAWNVSLSVLSLYSSREINQDYLKQFVDINNKLLETLPESHPFRPIAESVIEFDQGNTTKAVATVAAAMDGKSMNDEFFIDMVRVLSIYEYSRGNMEQWRYMMALATIIEIRSVWLDGESLRQLCAGLSHIDETDRAHRYLLETQVDNARSGALMRGVLIFDAVPLISENFHHQEAVRNRLLYGVIGLLFVLLVVGMLVFIGHMRHREKLLDLHSSLEIANERKEDNLGHFITLCSSYMERLEDFNRIVVQKLGAGQVNELHSLAKSGKYVDDQRRQFYEVFDSVFMNMYPTFIDDVNRLCQPDKQVKLSENGMLTPELRILAFLRLGTDDGARIARLLGLSLNTVYTYRNRAKSRAKNRETFEADIMNIGRVELDDTQQ